MNAIATIIKICSGIIFLYSLLLFFRAYVLTSEGWTSSGNPYIPAILVLWLSIFLWWFQKQR